MTVERDRIEFLVSRDGAQTAREWVRRTRDIYREALANPHHYASSPYYRPLFEHAVREFENWLAGQGGRT